MNASAVVALLVGIAAVAWALGYSAGKKTMIELLRIHLSEGRSFADALEYEHSVGRAKVPRA